MNRLPGALVSVLEHYGKIRFKEFYFPRPVHSLWTLRNF